MRRTPGYDYLYETQRGARSQLAVRKENLERARLEAQRAYSRRGWVGVAACVAVRRRGHEFPHSAAALNSVNSVGVLRSAHALRARTGALSSVVRAGFV